MKLVDIVLDTLVLGVNLVCLVSTDVLMIGSVCSLETYSVVVSTVLKEYVYLVICLEPSFNLLLLLDGSCVKFSHVLSSYPISVSVKPISYGLTIIG